MLVEFASVVDAVRCAVEVQQATPARNAGVAAVLTTREETLGPVAPLYARADRIFNRCAAPSTRWPAKPKRDAQVCA